MTKRKLRDLIVPAHVRKAARILFRAHVLYPLIRRNRGADQGLARHEYKVLSQHGEDGIVDYLFSVIGYGDRRFVEFGFHPAQANTILQAACNGFSGLYIDADGGICALAEAVFRDLGLKARVLNATVTPGNVNMLCRDEGIAGEIDLLSIDIDSVDYWVWQAIDCVAPRLVIVEYNASFGPELRATVPADFARARAAVPEPLWPIYHGASLAALARLAEAKGYRLIGCESCGVNAFFLRADVAPESFPAAPPGQAYVPHRVRRAAGWTAEREAEALGQMPLESL